MLRSTKNFVVARVATTVLMTLAVTVLVNRYFIRQHQADLAIVSATDKLHIMWDLVATQLLNKDPGSLPILSNVYGTRVVGYIVSEDGEVLLDTESVDLPDRSRYSKSFVTGDAFARGLSGYTDSGVSRTENGQEVLTYYGPLTVHGETVALVLQADLDSIRSRETPIWYRAAELIAIVALGFCVLSYFASIYIETHAKVTENSQIEQVIIRNDALQSSKLLEVAANRSNVAMIVFNDEGSIIHATNSASAIFGYTSEELKTKGIADFLVDDQPVDYTTMLKRLHSVEWIPFRVVVTARDSLGNVQRLKWNIERLMFDGKLYGVASTIRPFNAHRELSGQCPNPPM